MENRLSFELLQVAIGNRKSLSVSIADADWYRLFEFCKKQALIGVGFTAVEKLHAMGVVCPAALRMQWMALALQIETRNVLLNEQCRQLTDRYKHDGFVTCILKGQGNCINYPEDLRKRRQCGDIDIWASPICDISVAVQTGSNNVEYATYNGFRAVREYVRMQHRLAGNNDIPKQNYHHIEAPTMDGTEVEVHFRAAHLYSPLRNWRLQKWMNEHADECMKNKTHLGFAMPTSSVNVLYQMTHMFKHHIDGGLGFRHLMDYYYALRVWHNDVMECKDLQTQGMWSEGLGTAVMSKEEVMAVIRSFGMKKFASAVMYVLHKVFAIPTNYYICEPNEKEGRKLLEEIMKGGNFGQYDTRDAALKKGGMMKHGLWKLKRVMRLVRSYPEEALWEPVFRVYHLGWRMIHY